MKLQPVFIYAIVLLVIVLMIITIIPIVRPAFIFTPYYTDPLTRIKSKTPRDWLNPEFNYGPWDYNSPVLDVNAGYAVITQDYCSTRSTDPACVSWNNFRKEFPQAWPNVYYENGSYKQLS